MKRLIVILPVLFLIFCSEPRKGNDWPTFRGNYYRTGYSPDAGPSDNPGIIWRIDLQAAALSSPIIADGWMYIGYRKGVISADPYSGEIRWEFATEKKVFCTPSYYQGDIVFGSWDKYVYRLRGGKGDSVWSAPFPAAVDCSPVIVEDSVYVGDFMGLFTTIAFKNGYIGRIFATGDWLVGSAAFDAGTFYFGGRNSKFYALNKENFKPEWEFDAGGDISGTPAIDTLHVFFGSNNMKFYCLDRKSGEMIWEFDTNGAMFSSPAIYNEKVFFGSTDSTIYCLYQNSGEEIWRYRTEGIVYSSAAVCGNRVYIGCHDGYLYALDTETGDLVWREFLGAPVTSSPAIYDDILIVANDGGVVFAFR
ncbi:MAG: PQQ-binding-like beta-propeller repeat protein [Candidatus Zixiibacteriota bacterium]|nr:MAG: PQQ-binding-like beta-propeller repeat protein [candidate division Zixibacteria bacterium]